MMLVVSFIRWLLGCEKPKRGPYSRPGVVEIVSATIHHRSGRHRIPADVISGEAERIGALVPAWCSLGELLDIVEREIRALERRYPVEESERVRVAKEA